MSLRSYELVDVSVDTSGLDARLAEIEQKLEDASGVSEDRVQEMIDNLDYTYIRQDAATYVTEDDFDSKVTDAIANEGYVTEDDVQSKIDDALEGYVPDSVLDEADVDRIVGEHLNRLGLVGVDARIDRVAHSLEQRIVALEAKLDALGTESAKGLTLFDLLTQAARILGILR